MQELDIRGATVILDDEDYERFKDLSWFVGPRYTMNTTLRIPMHKMIIECPDGMVVDHINGNPLDNRRSNLRVCTQSENLMNTNKRRGDFSSKYKGVSWDNSKQRWRAMVYKSGKKNHAGYHRCEVQAAEAYNRKAVELYGEFARLNVI